ncbi:MAG: hypothetical protein ACRC7N_03825 [Clostridium sp.]
MNKIKVNIKYGNPIINGNKVEVPVFINGNKVNSFFATLNN